MAIRKGEVKYARTFTRHQIREVDACAINEYGIPEQSLIENAGRVVAEAAFGFLGDPERLPRGKRPRICVVCGKGNNGADGYAAARHLFNMGFKVAIVRAHRPKAGTAAAVQAGICRRMGIAETSDPSGATLIIDALYGTGLSRSLGAADVRLIKRINAQRGAVLSIDIPSGLDADSGEVLGAGVEADLTVTFVGLKEGMVHGLGAEFCGEILVADIGIPVALHELGRIIAFLG